MELYIGGKAQGKLAYVQNIAKENVEIWNDFHLFVKDCLEKGLTKEEMQQLINQKISSVENLYIISDEIGNGIVPLKKEEREYRDITGELLQEIASQAEKVVRITCGIGQQIK